MILLRGRLRGTGPGQISLHEHRIKEIRSNIYRQMLKLWLETVVKKLLVTAIQARATIRTTLPRLPSTILADPKSISHLYQLVKRLSNSQWERIINGAVDAVPWARWALPDNVEAASGDFVIQDNDDDE
ncbi:hypothetical protein FPV67DRAFT_1445080 [Lyophyllum atratum]|nr:hypothetical protein FPV67DRAFT_1445080 [Lyophyllum atratum]